MLFKKCAYFLINQRSVRKDVVAQGDGADRKDGVASISTP
jgi:hypothetical protein